MRAMYGLLLRLHPQAFRERFAAEMMLNFEEAGPGERPGGLLFDCFVSLLRQWLLRTGSWKLMSAVLLASLQVIAISAAWHARRRFPQLAHASFSVSDQQDLGFIVVCATAFIVVLATMIALWVRSLVAERSNAAARRRRLAI